MCCAYRLLEKLTACDLLQWKKGQNRVYFLIEQKLENPIYKPDFSVLM